MSGVFFPLPSLTTAAEKEVAGVTFQLAFPLHAIWTWLKSHTNFYGIGLGMTAFVGCPTVFQPRNLAMYDFACMLVDGFINCVFLHLS